MVCLCYKDAMKLNAMQLSALGNLKMEEGS